MRRLHRTSIAALVCLLLAGMLAGQEAPTEPDGDTPRDLGLREQTRRRLAQLDVSVTGPEKALAELTAADFELVVAGNEIEGLLLDRVCPDRPEWGMPAPEAPAEEPAATVASAAAVPVRAPATFLFYFDQTFLTMGGRNTSLDLAQELIPELVTEGNLGMVVSSGQVLETFADLTGDVEELLAGVERIRKAPKQWDPTSITEETRIAEVQRYLSQGDTRGAISRAKFHQSEERWRSEKAMRRFSIVLGRLAVVDPPKAVIYFADRLRSRPGEHYLSFFSSLGRENNMSLRKIGAEAFMAMNTFDNMIDEANANGARVYTIQAEGLGGETSLLQPGRSTGSGTGSTTRHLTDASDSLSGLAVETGGEYFLGGMRTAKIVDRIRTDLSCLYLLSFDPRGLPEDRALSVVLRVNRPKLRATTRGRIYLQSESTRLTSRLMGAFAAPHAVKMGGDVRANVIPTGFNNGEYSALVQVFVEGSPLPGASWNLGASQVSRDKVHEDISGSIAVASAETPVVLETEMSFAPGPYELVMVAHETRADQVSTGQIEGAWPDLKENPITVVDPIAILQPAGAVFSRDGNKKVNGALGRTERDPVRTDLPALMVSLICHARSKKQVVEVERRLIGDSSADFPVQELELSKSDRCAQFQDMIQPGTMTEGGFRYEVRVLSKGEAVAVAERKFYAVGPESETETEDDTGAAPDVGT